MASSSVPRSVSSPCSRGCGRGPVAPHSTAAASHPMHVRTEDCRPHSTYTYTYNIDPIILFRGWIILRCVKRICDRRFKNP